MAYDERLAARIRKTVDGTKDITEKKMFGGLAFLQGGAMFCGIVGDNLMVRIGPDAYDAALTMPHVRPMDFTGRPMRGYVYVGAPGCNTQARVTKWVTWGRNFVSTLGARPSVDADLRTLLSRYPPAIAKLVRDARGLFKKIVPGATEGVRSGWKLLGFSAPRYFACIAPLDDRVRIGFEHGMLLEDPAELLEAGGTQMKWITLNKRTDLNRPGIAALIAQAAELAASPRGTGRRTKRKRSPAGRRGGAG